VGVDPSASGRSAQEQQAADVLRAALRPGSAGADEVLGLVQETLAAAVRRRHRRRARVPAAAARGPLVAAPSHSQGPGVDTDTRWRGEITSTEVNRLHAEAFGTRVHTDEESDWARRVEQHSLGWVTARRGGELVGFLVVVWDGGAHAWLQDVVVAADARHLGIGTGMVACVRREAALAGCEWLHVDFAPGLRTFYVDACGFRPTESGLVDLTTG